MFNKLFLLSPILIFTVMGKSMKPTFLNGEKIIAVKFMKFKKKDVVVLKDPRNGRLLLKRITHINNDTYFVEGDNPNESTDSNHFGWINKKQLIAKVVFPLR